MYFEEQNKLEPNHSVDIIHSSLGILGPAHSMNAVWNTCTVRRSEKSMHAVRY